MKNLLLNVIRSFKRNKMSIIGLIFLLFFGLGVFATMSNTTANIRNEYTSLANKGKLHDFTASELYDVGSAYYSCDMKGISYLCTHPDPGTDPTYSDWTAFNFQDKDDTKHIDTTTLYPGTGLGTKDNTTYFIPIPEQEIYPRDPDYGESQTVIRTYHLFLDQNTSTGLYQSFAEQNPTSEYVHFTYKVVHTYVDEYGILLPPTPQKVLDFQDILDDWNSPTPTLPSKSEIQSMAENSIFSDDYQGFIKFLSEHTQNVFSVMTTDNTPLTNYIKTNFGDEVEQRFFKSMNVTATEDKIFYKIIESNPHDNIDTMVLFKDPVNRTGNQLFDPNDWQPYDSKIAIYDFDDNVIKPGTQIDLPNGETLTIPHDFNEISNINIISPTTIVDDPAWKTEVGRNAKYVYSQILHIRFKRMFSGDCTSSDLKPLLKDLAAPTLDRNQYAVQIFSKGSSLYTALQNYFNNWYLLGESITISSNGNVVITWIETMGTIQTCTITNWTSHFSIVNPQHLEKNNKRVMDPSVLNDFVPYREWYKVKYKTYPSGEIRQSAAASWFNSLTQDQLGFWMNPNTKTSWSTMTYEINGLQDPIVVVRGKGINQWSGIDKQFIAECGGYNQIIWGCGMTPDFMYPVVDITRPTPNTLTECLVYCNEVGYQTIKLAFVNSTVEEYLIGRFMPNVSTGRRHEIIDNINTWASQNMIFPDNVKSAYFADDTNNVLNCSGYRVSYIPNLVNVIQIVTTILCSFIGILCLVICFVIIKRYVENNRINIGIMRANGIKKWKIGVSMLPFAFFPALIGGVSAYVVGLFLQAPALSLFKSYWMLPTPLIGFDWVSFLAAIFLPFLVFGLICFLATLLVLRENAVDLMKSGSEFKANSFSRIAKKPFKHFGILTRFRVALAFNSISRLLMLAAMSCLTMSSLVFAFTTFDKLNASKITNSTQFDYSFNVQLTTPTASGSVYSVYDYSQPISDDPNTIRGFGWANPEQYLFNSQWDTTDWTGSQPEWATQEGVNYYKKLTKWYAWESIPDFMVDDGYFDAVGHNGCLMLPSMSDSSGQDLDLLYLQSKLCSRLTLDYNIGVPGIATSNPWEIALALMPANSRNIAADRFNTIMNNVGHKIKTVNDAFLAEAKKDDVLKNHITESGHIWASENIESIRQKVKDLVQNLGSKWFNYYEWDDGDLFAPTYYWKNSFEDYFKYDPDTDTYSLDTNIETVGYLGASFKASFVKLIRTIYTDKELVELEYPITYGSLPINWDRKPEDKKDETYTYITAKIVELSNHHKFDPGSEITIEGITDESQYINLTDKNGNNINSWLFSENYLNSMDINEEIHPIIVNAYAAHKYGLKVGDQVRISATNTVTRFDQKLHPENFRPEDNEATFKVVGISQGTNGSAFYTTQIIANDVLGLPNGKSWNKTHKYMMWSNYDDWSSPSAAHLTQLIDLAGVGASSDKTTIYKFSDGSSFADTPIIDTESVNKLKRPIPVGFNGIYTENTSGKPITASLSLYSYTGMYPGTSVYKSNGNNKFAHVLAFGSNLAIANLMSGIKDPVYYKACADHLRGTIDAAKYEESIQSFIEKVVNTFGDTTMVTAICGAMDVAASDLIYSNLISTFNLAETTIMSIIIPITIIIVAIISNLIIGDSKKMSAMLKALGYSDAKNLMSILALFVPTIILGLALAVPLSFGLTIGYQSLIFSSANILVDVTQQWWYYLAAIGGIGLILIGTYAIGYISIKRSRLVDEIK